MSEGPRARLVIQTVFDVFRSALLTLFILHVQLDGNVSLLHNFKTFYFMHVLLKISLVVHVSCRVFYLPLSVKISYFYNGTVGEIY